MTLLKYIKGIRKLLLLDYKSKELIFVKENLEMPALYLLNKFLKYLQEHGTTFNFRVSILLIELLYFDFEMPFSPDGNSMEDNTAGFKDPNAPSKVLYWKMLTNAWSSSEFKVKDLDLVTKCKFISDQLTMNSSIL